MQNEAEILNYICSFVGSLFHFSLHVYNGVTDLITIAY